MSTPNPTPAGGQAPTSGQPQAGIDPASQAGAGTPQSSQAPSSGQQPGSQPQAGANGASLTPDQLAAEIARLTRELGDTRREAGGYRTELKKFQDAQLTEAQKLEQRATDAEKARDTYRQRLSAYAVQLEAQKLGIVDPELAALAITSKLEFDEDGTPKNATKLLTDLIAAKPWLAGAAGSQGQQAGAGQQRPPASSGGAANPGAGARTGVITRAAYAAMSQQEKLTRNKEVLETMRQNGGRLPD